MIFKETILSGAYIIDPEPFQDDRGLFARTYCKKEFEKIKHSKEFVQFNHSVNIHKGTIRGLHYQKPPFAEIKLIRCVKGAVCDVIIDIRKGSPTFLKHITVELSADNLRMIYIPEGFAHGFQTLEDDSALIYHHTAYYTPGMEGGLRFNDPALKIEWPLPPSVISEKDNTHPFLLPSFIGL